MVIRAATVVQVRLVLSSIACFIACFILLVIAPLVVWSLLPVLPSGVFRNLQRGYISSVHFQNCSNFSHIFTLNISTKMFLLQRGRHNLRPPKYASAFYLLIIRRTIDNRRLYDS